MRTLSGTGIWKSRCLTHVGCRCSIAWSKPSRSTSAALDIGDADHNGPHPITINISGPVCLTWTPSGSRQGRSHMSTEPWLLWSLEMQQLHYDVVFLENSSLMPPGEFASQMQMRAETLSIVFSPHELGLPVRRGRLMSAAIDRSSMVWLGPGPADALGVKQLLRQAHRR